MEEFLFLISAENSSISIALKCIPRPKEVVGNADRFKVFDEAFVEVVGRTCIRTAPKCSAVQLPEGLGTAFDFLKSAIWDQVLGSEGSKKKANRQEQASLHGQTFGDNPRNASG